MTGGPRNLPGTGLPTWKSPPAGRPGSEGVRTPVSTRPCRCDSRRVNSPLRNTTSASKPAVFSTSGLSAGTGASPVVKVTPSSCKVFPTEILLQHQLFCVKEMGIILTAPALRAEGRILGITPSHSNHEDPLCAPRIFLNHELQFCDSEPTICEPGRTLKFKEDAQCLCCKSSEDCKGRRRLPGRQRGGDAARGAVRAPITGAVRTVPTAVFLTESLELVRGILEM